MGNLNRHALARFRVKENKANQARTDDRAFFDSLKNADPIVALFRESKREFALPH
jgi:hypothetical protein